MFILMVVIFVLGYTAIALEHPLKVDKAASALLIGVLTWTVYALFGTTLGNLLVVAWSNTDTEISTGMLQILFYVVFIL